MTEEQALSAKRRGFVDYKGCLGYFSLEVANFLVKTKKYVFQQSTCWGYVLRKV